MIKQLRLVRRNSGKLAATSTLALLGLGLGHQATVQADELTVAPVSDEPTTATSTTAELVPTTVAEANAMVIHAQADADSASEAFADKESQVNSQSTEADAAASEVATLEEQLASAVAEHSEAIAVKSEGTSEHISELASELTSATSTFHSESAVNVVNQSVADSQSQTVTSASIAASETAVSASEAAAKVAELNSLVNSPEQIATDLTKAKAEVTRLEREVSVAEKAATSATAAANADLAKKLASKQDELSRKQSELSKLTSSQETVKVVSVKGSNKIVLPSTYQTEVYPALKTIENSGWTFSSGYNTAVARLKTKIESGAQSSVYGVSYNGSGVNSYQSIAADKTRYINPDNLSVEIQNELAQFTGELLNDVRTQLGLTTLTVTKTAQEFAAAIANDYRRTGFGNLNNAHNFSIVGKQAQNHGLSYSDNRGYESLGFFGNAKTVDQLKNYFYNSIVYMLFNDVTSNYGHTISLLQNNNKGSYYLGVAATSNAQHIYVIPSANVQSARFNTTSLVATRTVDNSAKISAVKSAMATIQSEIADLKAQKATVSSSTSVVRAKDKLKSLSQQLSASRDNYKTLVALKTKLAANKSQLMTQLEKAKQVKALRLQEQVVAQDNLTKELKKYQVLQAAASQSKTRIANLKAQMAKLSENLQKYSDPDFVERTQARVRSLKSDLQNAKASLEVNVKALELLQEDLQTAAQDYERTKSNLDQAKEQLSDLIAATRPEVSEPSEVTTQVNADTNHNAVTGGMTNATAVVANASFRVLGAMAKTRPSMTKVNTAVSSPVSTADYQAASALTVTKLEGKGDSQKSSVTTNSETKSDTAKVLAKTADKETSQASTAQTSDNKSVATIMVAGATVVGLAALAFAKKRQK